jgi:cytochrome c-type biogenesis protein CcmH
MITFWLVCGLFIVIALAFVLPPLLQRDPVEKVDPAEVREANITVYRDQLSELETDLANGLVSEEQYQQDREEIERRLLEDVSSINKAGEKTTKPQADARNLAYAMAIAIPVLAVGLYLKIGNPNARPTQPPATEPTATMSGDTGRPQEQIEANVAALAQRMEANPSDGQGWAMLGRSYSQLEKYSEASKAFEKATALKTDDADLLADYAFALAMANGQKLAGKPAELVKKAYQLDPNNPKVLELAGNVAFQANDYKQAIEYWTKLQQRVPADSEVGQALAEKINQAKSLSGPVK